MKKHLALVVVALTAAVGPASAQRLAIPKGDPLNRVSGNLVIIQTQLQLGLVHERQALAVLKSATGPEGLADLRTGIYDGYVQVRFAENGLRYRQASRRVMNPLYDELSEQLNQAMYHIREADLAAKAAEKGDIAQLPRAIQNLETAITIVEQVAPLI